MTEAAGHEDGLIFTDAAARKVGELVGVHVIPRPVEGLGDVFPIE